MVTVQRLMEASQGGHSTKIGGGIPGWSQYKEVGKEMCTTYTAVDMKSCSITHSGTVVRTSLTLNRDDPHSNPLAAVLKPEYICSPNVASVHAAV